MIFLRSLENIKGSHYLTCEMSVVVPDEAALREAALREAAEKDFANPDRSSHWSVALRVIRYKETIRSEIAHQEACLAAGIPAYDDIDVDEDYGEDHDDFVVNEDSRDIVFDLAPAPPPPPPPSASRLRRQTIASQRKLRRNGLSSLRRLRRLLSLPDAVIAKF